MSNNTKIVTNRYDFLYFFDCKDGNPNGDPDAGNMPRIDLETMHGLVSDVALKRKVRDYVLMKHQDQKPYRIFIQDGSHLYIPILESYEELKNLVKESESGDPEKEANTKFKLSKQGIEDPTKLTNDDTRTLTLFMCESFYDIRTFGAVMSLQINAGQVRGPVQMTFARSLDQIRPMDLSITRVARSNKPNVEKITLEAMREWQSSAPQNFIRTMGRKQLIPYGLYVARGFVNPHLAAQTGFTENDLDLLWEALLRMFELTRSASKGYMSARKLIIFKHTGDEAKLGCDYSWKLLDLGRIVTVRRKDPTRPPRCFEDYEISIDTKWEREESEDGLKVVIKVPQQGLTGN